MSIAVNTLRDRTRAARAVARDPFGARFIPIAVFTYLFVLRSLMVAGTAVDRLFFRKVATVTVDRPVVIIGNHRTGSTFLQRFLHDQGFGAGMKLYQLLFPSLTLQVFLRPLLPALEAVAPTRFHHKEIHDTGLTIVETDDAGVTFRFFDGFFLYGFILAHLAEEDLLRQFTPEGRDTAARDWAWLRELWKRSTVNSGGQRVIAKLFSATPQVPAFQREFPDAKLIYLARDPLNVIPSTMSLLVSVLGAATSFDSLPPEVRARYFQRIYGAVVELMRRFHEDWTSGKIDRTKVLVVRFDRMMSEFEPVMDEICAFAELPMTDAQRTAVAERGKKQRAYHSGHGYDLAKFGLDEATIRRDCAFFYDTFLPPLAAAAPPHP